MSASIGLRGYGVNIRARRVVIDDDTDGGVGVEVEHVPLLWEGEIALVDLQQQRMVVVRAHRHAVKLPQRYVRSVREDIDPHRLRKGRLRNRHGEERLCEGEVVVGARIGVGHIPPGARRRLACVGIIVVDSSYSKRLPACAAREIRAHPKRRLGVAGISRNEDIGTLADTQRHNCGVVWVDGSEVIGDDRERVPVYREALNAIRARINQTQTMRLPRLEFKLRDTSIVTARRAITRGDGCTVEIHLPVDQVVVRRNMGRTTRG